MNPRNLLRTAITVIVIAGCVAVPVEAVGGEVCIPTLPPSESAIIEAALRSHEVPLRVHWSCPSGDDDGTSTIGSYIAELISYLEPAPDQKNWVEVTAVPRHAPSGLYWRATVMFHIILSNGDPWQYGVEFLIRQRDGCVVPSSFSCPGVP